MRAFLRSVLQPQHRCQHPQAVSSLHHGFLWGQYGLAKVNIRSLVLESVVWFPTQSKLTNQEGVQPQFLESFQVPPQVLDPIISERVAPRDFVSAEILVDDPSNQELRPTGEVKRSIHPRERRTLHRARALTRLPPSQKYLPSIVTVRRDPAILDLMCVAMQSYMARNRSR